MSTYLDTRDLDKRKTELEDLRDAVTTAEEELKEAQDAALDGASDEDNGLPQDEKDKLPTRAERDEAVTDAESNLESAQINFGDDEKRELAELEELESEISEWRHGETLIPESDFEDYARQLAEDIGAIDPKATWPIYCIDWERAARELAMDYTEVEYQGTTYLVHSH